MFAIQIASLASALSVIGCCVDRGVMATTCIHTLHVLVILKAANDLRSPTKQKLYKLLNLLSYFSQTRANIVLRKQRMQKI